ncbi:MAG: hypothetical protein WDO18_07195 [Acidobacteriota bacterium]
MKKPVLAGILIVLVILGIMIYSSLNLSGHRVEVCVEFRGQTTCKIARGADEQTALRTAIDNACGEMASGVTDSMACTRSQPTKVTILK